VNRTLDDEGRDAVTTAMRLFNGYASQIGARVDYGRQPRQAPSAMGVPTMPAMQSPTSLADLRKLAVFYHRERKAVGFGDS